MDFCGKYDHHFVGQGRNSVIHARHYLSGLFGTQRRKNIETIENDVPKSNYQGLEQFISSSPWSARNLLNDVARDADSLFGDDTEAGLLLDESCILKKGDHSVGVQRQWAGRVGKIENCQVGVFASLANGDEFALIDFRLFLPESWAEDQERCEVAKIPKDQRGYRPKWQLALEMVKQARENQVRFGWVGADGLYGNNQQFLDALEDIGEKFMADVHCNLTVWLEEPELEEPVMIKGKRGRGRPSKGAKLRAGFDRSLKKSVTQIVDAEFEKGAKKITFRQGAKGKLTSRFYAQTVWVWDQKNGSPPRQRTLIVREDESGEMKYSLCNFPIETELSRLAYIQNQRYWIEHSFHEAKSQLGMSEYQVRVWPGWHHHMALVCLATVFMAREKRRTRAEFPLLSCRDIVELLDHYLPRRGRDEKEVHEQIKKRHAARQRDLDRRKNQEVGLHRESRSRNLTK